MTNLRKNKTNTLLKKALIELLTEKSFEEIKLTEICERAMVHKTTFYHHFEDKYDLLNSTIQDFQEIILNSMEKSNDLISYYMNMAKSFIKIIKENPEFYRAVLMSDRNSICTEMAYQILINDVEKKLESLQEESHIHYIAIFYASAVLSVISEWVLTGMKETEEEIMSIIESHVAKINI